MRCWTVHQMVLGLAAMTRSESTENEQKKLSSSCQALVDRLKVTVVVEPSPLTYLSGYSNRFRELFDYLSEKSDDVRLITTEAVVKYSDRPDSYKDIPIVYTSGFCLPHYPMMSVSFDWNLTVLRQLLRYRPHILHVSSPGFYVLSAVVWARCLQIPLLLSYHTHLPVYVRSYLSFGGIAERLTWWLIRLLHSLADVTVVTSSVIKEEFRDHGVPRVHVWPKGIDTQRFHPRFQSVSMRERITDGHPKACLVLYVGRIAKEKRLDDLKAILDRLPPHFRLALVGKGPYEETLKELFADSNRVVFVGPLYGDDLSAAYASADVFCFPSDSETLGFVAMEAMASGIPVVAARAGGIPDMIEHGTTGYLIPVGDVDAYAELIQKLGDNAELRKRIRQQARTATEEWAWEKSMVVLRNEMYEKARQNFNNRFEQRLWRLLNFQKRL